MQQFLVLALMTLLMLGFCDALRLNRPAKRPSSRLAMAIPGVAKVDVPGPLVAELREYLAARAADPKEYVAAGSYSAGEMERMSKAAAKEGEGFDIGALEQTGWYRDDEEIARSKTYDATIPIVAHPFSFIELEQYGYGKLSDKIVDLGGPFIVAAAIGFEWEEPKFITVWDENLRPVRTKTFNLDMRGSLGLGGSLEDKLSAAADMDMKSLKEAAERKSKGEAYIPTSSKSSSSSSEGGRDYNEAFPKRGSGGASSTNKQEEAGLNRFPNINRNSVLAIAILVALGFGRTTTELITVTFKMDPADLLLIKGVCGAACVLAGTKIIKKKEQDAASV